MDDTHCKRVIELEDGMALVDHHFPLNYLPSEHSEVFVGMRKGTLKKATFELQNGAIISYEATGEKQR